MRIMIVGAGQVGKFLTEKLSVEGQEVVLVDRDEGLLRRLERQLNILPVQGSGSSAKVLERAGIDKTDLFIAVTDSDEVNLVACIISKQYNVKTRIARVRNEDFFGSGGPLSEKALGIDLLISPDLAITEEIIRLATMSEAFEVAEFAGGQVVLLGYVVHENNPCLGRRLMELEGLHGIMVAIVRSGRTIIPRGDDQIEVGDKIYLVVRRSDVQGVEELFAFASRAPRQVFIIGGGSIGFMVARAMERQRINVRLFERDAARCEYLTEHLDRTVVLHADGLEAQTLCDEGIDQADLIISVTNSDTTNILSSLLAKYHGAKKCITHITRPDFIPMLGNLGIDVALSPRLVAANMILRYVRGGSILSVATLLGSNAEVVEVRVPEKRHFADKELKTLNFPIGAIVGAIVRDREVIIPKGNTRLQHGDQLIIFFVKDARQAVEAFFE